MFIGFVPKDLEKLVSITKGSIDVIDWDRSSPLLQHVLLSDVTAIDQPKIAEGVRDGDFEKLGYTMLAFGRTGPLLLEKRVRRTARILFPASHRPFDAPLSRRLSDPRGQSGGNWPDCSLAWRKSTKAARACCHRCNSSPRRLIASPARTEMRSTPSAQKRES